jgi:multidrug resistance protein, MATE family
VSSKEELREIFALAGPLMLAQGGMMLMGVVDVMVLGRVGALDMAAVALGNSVSAAIFVFGIGLGMGVEPLIAQAHGAGEQSETRAWLWQGVWLSLLVSVPLLVATAIAPLLFVPTGLASDLAGHAESYMNARLPGVPGYCLMAVLRGYLSSRGRKWPILITVAVANVVNLFLDLGLVLGWYGMPKLGAVGAAWATNVAVVIIDLGLAIAIALEKRPERIDRRYSAPRMRRIVEIGWPIGSQATVETALFSTVAWAIGQLGDAPLAGHSIAVTVASLTFMTALGLANAATARVGFHIGGGRPEVARRSGLLAIFAGAAFMGTCGAFCLLLPEEISRLFTDDPHAIAQGIPLVRIAGVFSISDGIQAVSGGALRGAGDTRWPFLAHLGGYWIVGLPIGWTLARPLGLGAEGYWWGLTASLLTIAITLALRFWTLSKRPLARI